MPPIVYLTFDHIISIIVAGVFLIDSVSMGFITHAGWRVSISSSLASFRLTHPSPLPSRFLCPAGVTSTSSITLTGHGRLSPSARALVSVLAITQLLAYANALHSLVSAIVQHFFAYRIYKFTKMYWGCVIISMVSLGQLAFAVKTSEIVRFCSS